MRRKFVLAQRWLGALFIGATLGSAAFAGNHKPAFGGDFTFRKIAPPEPGTRKRITIQIEPAPEPEPESQASDKTEVVVADARELTGWFWQEISPALDLAAPSRFLDASTFLQSAPQLAELNPPRLEQLRQIAAAHGAEILLYSIDTRVSPALVLAMMSVESAGRVDAVSPKGAQGLMQLIPETAKRFGVKDVLNPAENIRGGIAYLDWLMSEFKGDAILALAAYNAGENAVRGNDGVPPYAETRAYVPKVVAAWNVARGLCLTPPDLPRDGCVFHIGG